MTAILRTEGLTHRWGSYEALSDVTLEFAPGARHAIIGPNGAGKTTLINLVAGELAPTSGKVFLAGHDVTSAPTHQRVSHGLVRTFQVTRLFPRLTVFESVMLAICERTGAAWHWWRSTPRHQAEHAEAVALLSSLRLESDATTPASDLPYGKQRLLEMALALATKPKVLLLDEPAAGLPREASVEAFAVLDELPRDVTVILVEHDMDLVFRFAERIAVLAAGRVLMEGTPAEVAADARVREVYLGEARPGA